MYIDVTLRFFFQFVDVGNVLIFFSNFSSCRIRRLEVSLVIHFTYCVSTCRYQFIGLALEFNFLWAVIHDCVIVFVNWLLIFVSYRILKGCSFSIFIVNEDISFNIRLDKVIIYIRRWFNRSWNWVVVWEWWITLQIRVYFTIWCCWVIRNRSFCLDFWNFTSNNVVTVITSTRRCQWSTWSTFEWTWISVQSSVHLFISICLSSRRPTSDNEWFASSSFVDFKIVVTIFTVYFCNFCLVSLPLFTSLINFTCVDKCVLRYIFSTNIRCSKIVHLRWIKSVEFRYSRTICIHDFRNTFHIVVVGSTLKFDQFLTDNTLTKDTRCFLSGISCCCYLFVTRDFTISWSCELLTSKTFLSIACKICFTSSWFVWLTFCVLAAINFFIMSCLINCCIRDRSLNVWFVFAFVTWEVGVADLKCFILKVRVDQWEGYVTWISSVSTCVSQSIGYIRVVVCDVAWKRDIAFSSMNSTSVSFCTIRLLHNTQVNIWVSWKATSDGWTVYCKSSVVIKVCFSSSSVICFKELPYTKSIAISIWIQSVTRFIESCIFNRCTIRIWNNWVSIDATSSACWDWSQLCSYCWCTINSCIPIETCILQGCHHIIYWLVQAWSLLSIWL